MASSRYRTFILHCEFRGIDARTASVGKVHRLANDIEPYGQLTRGSRITPPVASGAAVGHMTAIEIARCTRECAWSLVKSII